MFQKHTIFLTLKVYNFKFIKERPPLLQPGTLLNEKGILSLLIEYYAQEKLKLMNYDFKKQWYRINTYFCP
jgi:hypothetical protein